MRVLVGISLRNTLEAAKEMTGTAYYTAVGIADVDKEVLVGTESRAGSKGKAGSLSTCYRSTYQTHMLGSRFGL